MMSSEEKLTRNNLVSLEWCDKNIFVEAGAGAGKTTVVVKRVVNQLKWGKVKPEELVVITFTKKAAAELYDRISRGISDALKTGRTGENAEDILDDEMRRKLEYAQQNIDKMTVSTIHSFCGKLLKERAFDALSPINARVLEDNEEKTLKSDFFEGWYAQNIAKEVLDENKRYSKALNPDLKRFKYLVKDTFISISNRLSDRETKIVCPDISNYKGADYYEEVFADLADELFDDLVKLAEGIFGMDVPGFNDLVRSNKQTRAICGAEGLERVLLLWDTAKKGKIASDFVAGSIKRKLKDECADLAAEYSDYILDKISENEEFTEYLNYGRGIIMKTAVDAAKAYNAQKSREYITNDDMLIMARDLICGEGKASADARAYFAEKYKCIYIDEFQDTDHIQQEMLWRLSCDDSGRLRDGALFVVGDPKQSIYRFRGAELEIFLHTKELMEAQKANYNNAEVVSLLANFRSNNKIINWINLKFDVKFGMYRDCQNSVEYSAMDYVKTAEENSDTICGVYRYGGIEDVLNIETDASNLAALIRKLVDGKKRINKYENGVCIGQKEVEYRDFLIVTRKTTKLDVYLQQLLDQNIPVVVGMKRDGFENPAISRFSVLYNYLANSGDTAARAGAMQVAVGDEFFADDPAAWETAEKRITDLYYHTFDMDAAALAMYLANRTDLLLPLRSMHGSEVYSAQTQIKKMVMHVLNSVKGSRQTLAKAFSDYRASKIDNDMPIEDEKKINAVRIMNIHQVKGLEGGIVIIADRRADKPADSSHKEGNEYYHSIELDEKKFPVYEYYPHIKSEAEKAELQELLRLEYVAATRAMEALIFMDKLAKNDAWFCDYTETRCTPVSELIPLNERPPFVDYDDPQPYTAPKWEADIDLSQLAPIFEKINPSLVKGTHKKRVRPEPVEGEGVDKSIYEAEGNLSAAIDSDGASDEEAEENTNIRGDIFGTAMHRAFELTVNDFIAGGKDMTQFDKYTQTAVNRALIEGIEDMGAYVKNYKKRLDGMMAAFKSDTALLSEISAAKHVYTELPFSFCLTKEESAELSPKLGTLLGENIWVNGTADLVLVNQDDSVSVYDYKSNQNKKADPDFETHLYEEYSGQLALYIFAMKKMLKADNITAKLVNYQV